MEQKGKRKFIAMINGMISNKNDRGQTVGIELGTYSSSGILPDSYPEDSEPDDDFYLCSTDELQDGDRVLVVWTDAGDMVAIGPLSNMEGGEEDGDR